MYSLQTSVDIDGRTFHITNKGDFRMVLDCFSALGDEKLSEDYRVLASLLIFYNEFNTMDDIYRETDSIEPLVEQMFLFFNCGQKSAPGSDTGYRIIDWDQDSQMICSAVNKVANTEIRALPYLHWWTFMGYFSSVGESVLSTVVSIREKIMKHKQLDKWEKDFKRENPTLFVWNSTTVEDMEALDAVKELWNKE